MSKTELVNAKEIRSWSAEKQNETKESIRSKIAQSRMSVFGDVKSKTSDVKHLKKTLARIMTVQNESKTSAQAK